jgi:S1-C subfamily serine protease
MVRHLSLAFAASLLVASTALAQQSSGRPRTTIRSGPLGGAVAYARDGGDRLVLGLSTSSGGARDTLGLLVSSIASGGPAEKAGLEEGNRLVSVNGVALRLNASDAADPEMAGVLGRRLQRELEKVKPDEVVTLGVYANGQTREVKITPVRADELSPYGMSRSRLDSRSTIGASIGGFASPRDTLGVFVMAVAEDGPLAKAGVFEGSRIASVNGIDLRVPAADVGDEFMTSSRVRRLTREIEKLEAGANAELRVHTNGQYRNVTVKTVKRSELKQDGSISIFHSGGAGAVFVPPMEFRFDNGRFDMEHRYDSRIRDRIEDAMRGTELELRGFRDRWRDDGMTFELREQPGFKERSGGEDTMPVEEVLKQLQQRLREAETVARRPFRAAAATGDDQVMANSVGASFSGTFEFQPALASTRGAFGVGGFELQRIPPSGGAVGGAQGRSGGTATYRSSKPSAQGGVFMIGGIRMSPITPRLASYLGRGSERGLLILEISEEWTGVTEGDVILTINGKAVLNDDGIRVDIDESREQCVELLRAGATVKSVLRRR